MSSDQATRSPASTTPRRRATAVPIALGLLLVAAATMAAAAGAKPDKPKPRPKLELLTVTQDEVLRKGAIKVGVRSRRGDEARVKGTLVVDGFPDDYSFRLRPQSKRLRDREAKVRFKLSPRQEEVLEFSAQACDAATLKLSARAGKKTKRGKLRAVLPPREC